MPGIGVLLAMLKYASSAVLGIDMLSALKRWREYSTFPPSGWLANYDLSALYNSYLHYLIIVFSGLLYG